MTRIKEKKEYPMEWCKVKGCLGFVDTHGVWQKHNSIAHHKEFLRVKRRFWYGITKQNKEVIKVIVIKSKLNPMSRLAIRIIKFGGWLFDKVK